VALNNLRESFNSVIPNSNGIISRSRYNGVATWTNSDGVDGTLMSHKAEWPHIRFEGPHHYSAILRATNYLVEVWVEASRQNAFFVSLERPFECRVV